MLRLLRWLACLLPEAWLRHLGRWLGRFIFDLLRIRRSVALKNLREALGLEGAEARRLARQTYTHLATGGLEMLRVARLGRERAEALLGPEGLARLRSILAGGRGLLVLSAHLGHWDLLACAAGRCGLPVNVVTRSIKSGTLNRFWMAERAACGVRLLPASGSARDLLAALRRGEIVAMLIDQHQPGGIPVPFLGRPAATSTALARLARATGAPVVPAFLLRRGGGFELALGEPLPLRWSSDRGADIARVTGELTGVLEAAIRRDPNQWLWLHRRWKIPVPKGSVRGFSGDDSPLHRDTAQRRLD